MSCGSNRPLATPRHGQSSPRHTDTFHLAPTYPNADRGSRLNDLYIVAPDRPSSVPDDGNSDAGCLAMAAPVAPYVAETQRPGEIGPVNRRDPSRQDR